MIGLLLGGAITQMWRARCEMAVLNGGTKEPAMKSILTFAAVFILCTDGISAAPALNASDILRNQSQMLMDAASAGDPKPWRAFLDETVSYTDENGVLAGKKAMVDQVVPLPKGISGHINVIDWKATILGPVAVTTHVDDEYENYHGQHLHAQYRNTQTWLLKNGGWKLIAAQALALQQDPTAIKLPSAKLADYLGVYQGGPGFTYTIMRNGDGLAGQSAGGKANPVRFELADVAFADGQPRVRKLFQRDASGHIKGFVSRREGRDVVWTKVH